MAGRAATEAAAPGQRPRGPNMKMHRVWTPPGCAGHLQRGLRCPRCRGNAHQLSTHWNYLRVFTYLENPPRKGEIRSAEEQGRAWSMGRQVDLPAQASIRCHRFPGLSPNVLHLRINTMTEKVPQGQKHQDTVKTALLPRFPPNPCHHTSKFQEHRYAL